MYWTEREVAGIHRSDLDGSNLQTLVEGYGHPGWNGITGIALDLVRGKVYWTDSGAIVHTDLSHFDGADFHQDLIDEEYVYIIPSGSSSIALDSDGGKIYWTDSDAGTIYRADLDGQNRE